MNNKRLVARWEVRGGKRFLELYADEWGYTYTGEDCGGNLGAMTGDAGAIDKMEAGPVAVLRSDFPSVKRVR